MKKVIFLFVFILLSSYSIHSQVVKFGFKAGANFSDLKGDLETKTQLGYHFGVISEIKLLQNLTLQPELLYSTQGADVNSTIIKNINYSYVTVPVLAKLYVITDRLSLDVGPQFSFLIDDNLKNTFETNSFDFAAIGGIGLNFTKHVFAQARYVVGLTDTTKDAEIRNKVIQVSLGFTF